MRFLITYEGDIKSNYKSAEMINTVVKVLGFALSSGENFLPDPAAYDDLFYKLVESGDMLVKFRDTFSLDQSGPMQTLIHVSAHYQSLLESNEVKKVRNKHLSPQEVSAIIKQGYETLSIDASEGMDQSERYREADFRPFLKKIARAAVNDAKQVNSLE